MSQDYEGKCPNGYERESRVAIESPRLSFLEPAPVPRLRTDDPKLTTRRYFVATSECVMA
jgi:hypothetical protein